MTGAHYHALEHPTNDSTSKLLDRLQMPASVVEEMVRAVPDDVVRAIVRDNCPRAAPTPPAPKSTVDQLVERFGPPKA
jgi:hypothetical protein